MRPDGSGLEQVTEITEGTINTPNVSPDGSKALVLSQTAAAILDLTAPLPVKQVALLPLIDERLHMVRSSWSPNGRRIAGEAAAAGERGGQGIWVYEFDTGDYRKVLDGGTGLFSWLDDQTILVQMGRGRVVAVDAESGESKTVTEEVIGSPWTLSTDRTWVHYFSASVEGDVWMLDSE